MVVVKAAKRSREMGKKQGRIRREGRSAALGSPRPPTQLPPRSFLFYFERMRTEAAGEVWIAAAAAAADAAAEAAADAAAGREALRSCLAEVVEVCFSNN